MPGEQYIKDQAAIVDKAVSNADIVITTALLPGRDAPRLIKAETVAKDETRLCHFRYGC